MITEEQEDRIAELTNRAWEAWCQQGGLDAVEQTLGPVTSEPWNRVFTAGWKLGFADSVRLSVTIANDLGLTPPIP